MRPQARVSVVLPAHNEEQHLEQAIESILRQSDTNFEMIVVDDGSTDGSPEILARLARGDSRIRAFRQPHGGIVGALNRGLAEASGALIARMDADDVADPERLRLQAEFLDRHPDVGLVASRVEYLGDRRRNRGLALFVDWTNSLVEPADIWRYRFVETPFIHPSVMFRRELVERFGGYGDGSYPEDYELWLRWLERGVKMAKLPETLLYWRERPERLTRTDPRYGVDAFYRTKAPFLYRWLKRNNTYHPDVIVWGSGRTSRQRLRYLTGLGVKVSAFIDIDPRKIGYKIGGAPVLHPDDLPAPGKCFVLSWVGSRGARAEIEEKLAAKRYRIEVDYIPCA